MPTDRKNGRVHPWYSQNPDRKLNERQEAFAQNIATPVDETGRMMSRLEAYMVAYPTANRKTANKKASELLKMPAMKRRIAELREQRFKKLNITAEWVTEQLFKRYMTNVADYWKTVELDKEGNEYPLGQAPEGVPTKLRQVHKRLDELTPEQLEVLDGFSQETTARGGVKTKFEHDRKGALDALARGIGYFKDKVDVTSGGKPLEAAVILGLRTMSEDELDDLLARAESRKAS